MIANGRLTDRVALVTGGGGGIGRATALRLAAEGAHVVVVDIDAEGAAETASMIGTHGHAVGADLADVAEVQRVIRFVDENLGQLNVLFCNAGVSGAAGLDVDLAAFDAVVDVNLKGAFFLTSAAMPLLKRAAPKASIIYTSSASGLIGSPSGVLYSMSKGGVQLMMRSVAKMYGPDGVRANAVNPGTIVTRMAQVTADPNRVGVSDEAFRAHAERTAQNTPLRRVGTPEDVADVVLFLASDESSFVTGVGIPVDGGALA
ncbi:SDR family NAD(P)-dependent oxidoreductase [Microbacterium sp. CJ77]|uniref:SDR family NAD(P)-dependent oxidoreductase n=1 Tax=Microbacterium sp. CJ77 TaxID=2079201 RepID=UPI000CD9E374|nr:SDR family oxidoreductase [Microbacterium sp. CJ77]